MEIERRIDWINFIIWMLIIIGVGAFHYFVTLKLFCLRLIPLLFSFSLVNDIVINQVTTALIFIYVKGYFLNKQYKGDSDNGN